MEKNKVWFVTGTSKGFGRVWAEAALQRGDKVAATVRNLDSLKDLVEKYGNNILPIKLDVTNKAADFAAVKQAHEKFGRLDVVINNAGYGHFGMVEELSEEDARNQLETNFFAALWITQAALPIMREQKSGHILQTSSIGGLTTFPNVGMYHASKFALEGFTESLAQEVADFGIHVTLIEPGGYDTDFLGNSSAKSKPIAAYNELRDKPRATTTNKRGNPEATADAILKVVDAAKPPLRIFLGKLPMSLLKEKYAEKIKLWEEWNDVAEEAQGN